MLNAAKILQQRMTGLKMHVGLTLATVSIEPPPADAKYVKLKQLKQKAKQQNNAVFSLAMGFQ